MFIFTYSNLIIEISSLVKEPPHEKPSFIATFFNVTLSFLTPHMIGFRNQNINQEKFLIKKNSEILSLMTKSRIIGYSIKYIRKQRLWTSKNLLITYRNLSKSTEIAANNCSSSSAMSYGSLNIKSYNKLSLNRYLCTMGIDRIRSQQ